MGRVLTNNIRLAYAVETALGDVGSSPSWRTLEPNSLGAYGTTLDMQSREPISKNRQRRKGSITSLTSAVEYDSDLTFSAFRDFLAGFMFAEVVNSEFTEIKPTSTTATKFNFGTIAGASGRFGAGALIWASGFGDTRDGLKVTTGAANDSATVAGLNANDVPAGARISFAGAQLTAAEWTYDSGSKRGTLAKTGHGLGTARGLTVGQMVHIGSISSIGDTDFANGIRPRTGTTTLTGYGRVVSISANNVVFDKLSDGLQANGEQTNTNKQDILFGEFARNVPTDHADFRERTYQFEQLLPDLGDGTPNSEADAYQYAKGNFLNTLGLSVDLDALATMSFAFVGTDTANPTTTRASGSSDTEPPWTSSYSTVADMGRLRIAEADEDGITTDFKSISLTLNNNVAPERVVGELAAKYMNAGNFEVTLEAQLVFSNPLVVNKIRANERVTMDMVLKNSDGTIVVDIPSMTLGGGGRDYPVNESVLISVTSDAYQDPTLGTSLGISLIPVPLP